MLFSNIYSIMWRLKTACIAEDMNASGICEIFFAERQVPNDLYCFIRVKAFIARACCTNDVDSNSNKIININSNSISNSR